MSELIQSKEDLIYYLTTRQICNKEPLKSVYVTTKLRKMILTDELQGKFIHKGVVKQFGFKSVGGGVYEAFIERLKVEDISVKLTNNVEDSRKLLTDVDIRKIQEKAIKDAITYSAFRDDHQWSSYKAYEIMTKYAEKLGRGEL